MKKWLFLCFFGFVFVGCASVEEEVTNPLGCKTRTYRLVDINNAVVGCTPDAYGLSQGEFVVANNLNNSYDFMVNGQGQAGYGYLSWYGSSSNGIAFYYSIGSAEPASLSDVYGYVNMQLLDKGKSVVDYISVGGKEMQVCLKADANISRLQGQVHPLTSIQEGITQEYTTSGAKILKRFGVGTLDEYGAFLTPASLRECSFKQSLVSFPMAAPLRSVK